MGWGVDAFVEGRIHRQSLEPAKIWDMRKLAAIEACRHWQGPKGRVHASSITIAPNQWPLHAVIDWINC